MYYAIIDGENQRFVIDDRDGVITAIRNMPVQRAPNPGRAELMKEPANQEAHRLICDLVDAANRGLAR